MNSFALADRDLKNSTTVRAEILADATTPPEMSKRGFLTRATLLRLPFFKRAERAADLFCTPMSGTRARALSVEAPEFVRQTVNSTEIFWHKGSPFSRKSFQSLKSSIYFDLMHRNIGFFVKNPLPECNG